MKTVSSVAAALLMLTTGWACSEGVVTPEERLVGAWGLERLNGSELPASLAGGDVEMGVLFIADGIFSLELYHRSPSYQGWLEMEGTWIIDDGERVTMTGVSPAPLNPGDSPDSMDVELTGMMTGDTLQLEIEYVRQPSWPTVHYLFEKDY